MVTCVAGLRTMPEYAATVRALVTAALCLAALSAGAQGAPDTVVWDDFETGDARFWTSAVPILPLTVCTPPTAAVELISPTVLGDGTPGSGATSSGRHSAPTAPTRFRRPRGC